MSADRQERHDRFYFERGPCCAGCDWWRSINSRVGECTKNAPVDGKTRWAMLNISRVSMDLEPGHIATAHDHICGDFKDDFDWSSLPLAYRKRVGAPT